MNEYNPQDPQGQQGALSFFLYTVLHVGTQTVSVELDSTKKFIFLFSEKKCKMKFKNMF